METRRALRQHDSLSIPEGYIIEAYTPTQGPIISPSSDKHIQRVKIHLSEDATVTGRDARGNLVTDIPLSKGPCPYLWSEVHSVSTGSVWIVHDGVPASINEDMNYRIVGMNQ